jgi:anti-sigma factor ChrR (cupin superfamily)
VDCEQVRIGLAAYAFGCLDAQDRRDVTGHLAVCEPCRDERARYADLIGLMGAVLPWEAVPGAPSAAPGPERAIDGARDRRRPSPGG